jgi:chromate transporter
MTSSKSGDLSPTVATVPFWEAFRFWLKLGFIGFGGPAGQIAILHAELVERRRWISEHRFLHALNYCMLLPGPEATQMATYMGWLMHRTWGGVVAGVLFVLPSLLITIGLSWAYLVWGNMPAASGLLRGIQPVVTAVVLFAAYRLAFKALKTRWLWALALLSFLALFIMGTPFPWVVLCAATAGWAAARWMPAAWSGTAPRAENTPRADHTRFSRSHLVKVLLVSAALWLVPMGTLVLFQGWDGLLSQMAWFFSKAALVTFGGAYAVLPYVYQSAVDVQQWLTGPQMMHGLALGESTPGPLIKVVAFVGFLGGWQHTLLGPDWVFAGAALAATVAAYFTFLPSFVFILVGAPLIESTHGKLGFTAPLTAITAAVVGAILKLALFFSYHTWWPEGFEGQWDWMAASITVLSFWALVRLKMGVLPLIALGASAGLVAHYVA